jgi:hypothetical protein
LQLVPTGELAKLPCGPVLLSDHPRRPGDRHEVVDLPTAFANRLEQQAAKQGLSLAVAAALVIEARWLVGRLVESADLNGSVAHLDAVAETDERVHRPLGAAEADYLRALMMPRARPSMDRPAVRVAIPVRLLGRIDWDSSCDEDVKDLERAIRWETVAVLSRMTMSEWAFENLLKQATSAEVPLSHS